MTDGLHRVASPDALAALPAGGPVARLDAGAWALNPPDRHLVLVRDGALVGRASVWWTGPPPVPGEPDAVAGRVGHAEWADADAGHQLLTEALAALAAAGCTRALGPLDGSTWFAYRVVTDAAPSGGEREPPFLLEPWPTPVVAQAFAGAGFEPVAHYLSSRVDALPDESGPLADGLRQLRASGVTVRPFRPEDAGGELRRLHPLLLRAFAGNPFYTPLGLDRFLALYRGVLPLVDPALVLVAERCRRPVGVALGLPDAAQAARGERADTVVLKTLAVDPSERGVGLGGTLVRAVQEAARARGLTRAVHALMHAANDSAKISRHLGRPVRRYALLSRSL
jgi:GNAT superfamily N-acetyltransferase